VKSFVLGNIIGIAAFGIMPEGSWWQEIATAWAFMAATLLIYPKVHKWCS
jgi:hypothetical protein